MPAPVASFPFPPVIRRFMAMEISGGIVMLLAAALGMLAANSMLHADYSHLINLPMTFGIGDQPTTEPLKVWVKDILMVFFFLLIGLELKREAREGVLADKEQIILPLVAAFGGMALPACIYLGINHAIPANWAGWAIPSATDIAFALCVLTLVGRNIPPAVKIFLLAIAIFDDIGAILIIAFFYSAALNLSALALAALGVLALIILNRLKVSLLTPYWLVGIFLWFCLYYSGIHTTVAGVIVGLLIPMRSAESPRHSPVNHAIHFLHPWVSFVVLPVFAFTSTGIDLGDIHVRDLLQPLPLGIALALFIGKQLGIFALTWAMVKTGYAKLPHGATWGHVYGVSLLAGIGFTMSLFIGILAFPEPMQGLLKVGVIAGSLLSVLGGALVLRIASRMHRS